LALVTSSADISGQEKRKERFIFVGAEQGKVEGTESLLVCRRTKTEFLTQDQHLSL